MRLVGRAPFVLASVLISTSMAAQQAPQRDPQALAILTQSQAAMASSLAAIQDALAQGTIAFADGRTGTLTIKSKGSDRLRHEVNVDGRQTVVVTNRGKGHTILGGVRRPLPLWVAAYQRPDHIPALSRLSDFVQPNAKIAYLGLVEVAGRPAHHIRLSASPTDGTPAEIEEIISEFHVFVDAQSGLLVKTMGYDFSPEIIENRTPVETYYTDYRSLGGLLIPYHLSRHVRGQKFYEITLTNVALNVGLADTEFE